LIDRTVRGFSQYQSVSTVTEQGSIFKNWSCKGIPRICAVLGDHLAQGARVPVTSLVSWWHSDFVAAVLWTELGGPLFHSNNPPRGICCTTTLFPKTSA